MNKSLIKLSEIDNDFKDISNRLSNNYIEINELLNDAISKLSDKNLDKDQKENFIKEISLEHVDVNALGLYTLGELRKSTDKGPSFGEQFHTDSIYTKKPPRFTMLLSKLVPKKGKANTEFCSQYLAYKELPNPIKRKFKNIKGKYSSEGPISVTTKERVKEKGKNIG